MGAAVDNYDGEHVDVEEISVEELERIRAEICKDLEGRDRVTPKRVLLDDIDNIDDELEWRAQLAREEDRQEMADDDARAGLI
jgi:hypothetical protein